MYIIQNKYIQAYFLNELGKRALKTVSFPSIIISGDQTYFCYPVILPLRQKISIPQRYLFRMVTAVDTSYFKVVSFHTATYCCHLNDVKTLISFHSITRISRPTILSLNLKCTSNPTGNSPNSNSSSLQDIKSKIIFCCLKK